MELRAIIGFVHTSRFDIDGVLKCDAGLIADDRFGKDDFEKQAYALKVMDAELQAAVQRVNDRLKSEGYTKESFIYCESKQNPRIDEYGNVIAPI